MSYILRALLNANLLLLQKKAFNFFEVSQVQIPDDSSSVINVRFPARSQELLGTR